MDFNHLLLWLVALITSSLIVQAVRSPLGSNRGWLAIALLILAILGLGLWWWPRWAGWVGWVLWLTLVLLPLLGMQQVNRWVAWGRYRQARQLVRWLAWLHPFDGWRDQAILIEALELGQRGDLEAAIQILHRYPTENSAIGHNARLMIYRMAGQWEEMLIWLEHGVSESLRHQDPTLLSYYIRALGETGDLNGMMQTWAKAQPFLERLNDSGGRNLIYLYLLAFCGQRDEVEQLFAGPLREYSDQTRRFWLATADWAAGKEYAARKEFQDLRYEEDLTLKRAVVHRLKGELATATMALSADSQRILHQLVLELHQESRYSLRVDSQATPYTTYALIAINLAIFTLQTLWGGNTNLVTLVRLGALIPSAVLQGEWWRLLMANFLHFGWLHLAFNMIALFALGRFVEFSLGWGYYLFCYLASGIGAMGCVMAIALAQSQGGQLVVGASGAVMAMLGATGAILLQGWRQEKARIAGRRLRSILFVIVAQTAFDLANPQVSLSGHVSGLLLGFFICSGLLLLKSR